MNRLFYIGFIVMINSVSAQITIANDNYFFVDNSVVFSEDYLDLRHANSRFFLRQEAQLVQGSVDTPNFGVGELSLYQDGNVGAYEYNYWCSPIGEKVSSVSNNKFGIPLLNDITGVITSIPAAYNFSPDYNGTANPLDIEPNWIWKFIESDEYAEWILVAQTIDINPGEGFTMKGTMGTSSNNPGDNQNYDFRGKPNNGSISIGVIEGDWTLVGNPYPSALDARDYIWDIHNVNAITGTLYYWEQDQSVDSHFIEDYQGGYATYTINSAGTVETFVPATFNTYNGDGTLNTVGAPSSSGFVAKRYIPIAQGFMVEGKAGTNGTVIARNNHRDYYPESALSLPELSQDNEIVYDENGFNILPQDYQRFRLNIDFNNVYTRQLVQTFHHSASNAYDHGLESKSPSQVASDAFWVLEEEEYVAQAFSFNEALKIPLVIRSDSEQSITFRAFDIQNFSDDQPIYIHDTETNLYVDLREGTYEAFLQEGEHNYRFEIVFELPETLSLSEEEKEKIKIYYNDIDSELVIMNFGYSNISNIELYDITGKIILSRKNRNITEQKTIIDVSDFSQGTYILKLVMGDLKQMVKKVIF